MWFNRLIIIFCLGVLSAFSFASTVVGVGSSSKTNDGNMRIVFPLSEKTTFSSFRLDSPPRLVIDIPNAVLKNRVQSLPIRGKMVQNVRLGTQQGTDLRIVVDMAQPVSASTALVKGKSGYELIIIVSENATNDSARDASLVKGGETVVSEQSNIQVAKKVPKKSVLIVIDPGHGGKDPGALGSGKTREKDVVLAIARELKAKINREKGMRAVLTRDGDRFIPLRERVLIARRQKADMFISIHADAGSRTAGGASVYILSTKGASSEAARLLAESENKSDLIAGVKISDKDDAIASMLLDISQDATIEASNELGKNILANLKKDTKLHKKGVERANFAVLKAPDIPSVLIETGFISNPNEEKKLRNKSHQTRLANDILAGIKAYFKKRPATELVYSATVAPSKVVSTSPPVKIQEKPSVQNKNTVNLPALVLESRASDSSVSVSSYKIHIVARGETLKEIAKKYKVTETALKNANGLPANQLRVVAGTKLNIP